MTGKQATLEALGLSVNEKGEIQTKAISPSMPAIDIGDIGTTMLGGINSVEEKTFDDGTKIIIKVFVKELENSPKGGVRTLALNKTNSIVMLKAYGLEYEKWNGQIIEIKVESTLFKGKPTPCVRVYPRK